MHDKVVLNARLVERIYLKEKPGDDNENLATIVDLFEKALHKRPEKEGIKLIE